MTHEVAKLLTRSDVAALLQVSRPTVDRLTRAGALTPVYIGEASPRFEPTEIERFIRKRRRSSP